MGAVEPLPFFSRLVLAYVAFFRILFDGAFAARVSAVRGGMPELGPAPTPKAPENKTDNKTAKKTAQSDDAALILLGLLQQKGRLVDFLQQDITTFADADVGTAARLVHEGCRKVLGDHVEIAPVRDEGEGASIEIARGFDPTALKLVGDVRGDGPWRGTLSHRGWRAKSIKLPEAMSGADVAVLAPAEVELR